MNQEEKYTAKVIAHSKSAEDDSEICTLQVHMPRIILAEFNTHRVFSRNTRSTRAVPTTKLIQEVRSDPYTPLMYLSNKPGMQGGEPLDTDKASDAEIYWRRAAQDAAYRAEKLFATGLHKQWAGRVLEPYLWVDTLVTSTEWSNFFELRNHSDAQPEIQLIAQRMLEAINESPATILCNGDWHLPYVDGNTRNFVHDYCKKYYPSYDYDYFISTLIKVSVARCARVSYAPFDGNGDINSEVARYEKLVGSVPIHASPAEHQATPDTILQGYEGPYGEWKTGGYDNKHLHGNFKGWIQYRKTL